MLRISNLAISRENKLIVRDVSLFIAPGTVNVLMGPNGSGKSTLAHALMGLPGYEVDAGSAYWGEQDLFALSIDARARAGIFLAFQHPIAIPGVTVATLLKEARQAKMGIHESVKDFNGVLHNTLALLEMPDAFARRPLHDGFSGGEKKRLEMLQMVMLSPSLIILDELDSGLDVDGLRLAARVIMIMKEKNPDLAVLMITHNTRLVHYLKPDVVHVMRDGELVYSGDQEVALAIELQGYDQFMGAV